VLAPLSNEVRRATEKRGGTDQQRIVTAIERIRQQPFLLAGGLIGSTAVLDPMSIEFPRLAVVVATGAEIRYANASKARRGYRATSSHLIYVRVLASFNSLYRSFLR